MSHDVVILMSHTVVVMSHDMYYYSLKASKPFTECLSFAEHCSGLVGKDPLEKVTYTLRVQWCLAKWYKHSNNNGAIRALIMVCVGG